MTKETATRDELRNVLRAAGFELFQFEVPLAASSKVRPDVLAWAADGNRDLVPWAVVEIKTGSMKTPDLALPALTRSRDLLGTVDHYAVINGNWFKAGRGVRSIEPVDAPTPPTFGGGGVLSDEALATSLLLNSFWREADRERASGRRLDYFFPSVEHFAETNLPQIATPDGGFLPVRPDVLWRARRTALLDYAGRMGGARRWRPIR